MRPVIVIFGAAVLADGTPSGTLRRRVAGALAFGQARPGARYLVSGGLGGGGMAEWQAMRQLLLAGGVPAASILAEPNGADTLSQIRLCTAILRAQDAAADAWIATSRYHQPRCWLLFRLFGIAAGTVPALPDRPALPWRKLIFFWLREAAAVPYDAAVALLRYRLRV